MQMIIPEASSLQEAACRALYTTIKGSEAHRKIALSFGVVEAIICLILLHPNDVKLLDEAMNLLSVISTVDGCLTQIASNGGISAVVDTMHSNNTSVDLIIAGARFLRNAVLDDEKYANDVAECVSSIITCMRKNPESTELLVISCETLKCFITKSEACKKQLLTSQGRSILEKIIAEKKYKDRLGSSSVTIAVHSLLDELLC
jgi:hypothetical protein